MSDNKDAFDEDMEDVMKTSQGRRVLKQFIALSGQEKCSFNGQSNHTIFNEGKRAFGLTMKSLLKGANPDLYNKLLIEEEIYGD